MKYAKHIIGPLLAIFLTSCFTGIEGTKKITLSRDDKKVIAPTPEEMYLAGVSPTPNSEWGIGKEFVVTDERASLLIDASDVPSGDLNLHPGDILNYVGSGTSIGPDGKRRTSIQLRRGEDIFLFIARDAREEMAPVYSNAIPGVVDLAMVSEVSSLMKGKRFWTRSPLWTGKDGERVDGRKFVSVTIDDVEPGTMVFPVRVTFHSDDSGESASYLMNYGDSGKDSRGFSTLFSLTDPRKNYPSISDKVWDNITKGLVEVGMTKDECRLAKGNPTEVNAGHDYSKTLLLWSYPDAMVLYFEDGILVGINRFNQ